MPRLIAKLFSSRSKVGRTFIWKKSWLCVARLTSVKSKSRLSNPLSIVLKSRLLLALYCTDRIRRCPRGRLVYDSSGFTRRKPVRGVKPTAAS
jgi:hypothetical protein